jgi:membrane-associated protease RseP (regulator of RpoE activity)
MTVLAYLLGVLLFVVGVAASIALHEMGHLVPGKLFDVKVTQYFVGFGRTIWSRRRGETEYGVKAVPLGGYVKLVGMLPPGPGSERGTVRSSDTGVFSQLMSDARAAEYELVEEGDENRLFYKLSWWKKIVIMVSGVMTNLVIAFLLFAVVYMGHGIATPTTTVRDVSQCVIAVTRADLDKPQRACTAADPVAPAKKAGMRVGDRIVSFNGTPVTGWRSLQTAIRDNAAGPAAIGVVRDGERLTLHTSTTVSARVDPDHPARIERSGFLGVVPGLVNERQGIGYVVDTMATGTWQTVTALAHMPQKLYHVGRAAVGLEERDPEGPMSVVGAGRVAGELSSSAAVPVSDRFFSVVLLIAGLNLFLGLFNLVPLPPLDGGPIATTLYEAARRGIARVLHRPDPGFVDSAKLSVVASLVLIYADIVAPVSLG